MTFPFRKLLIPSLALIGSVAAGCSRSEGDTPKPVGTVPPPAVVTALGRIVPGRAVVSVAGSPGERIQRLLVKERDRVAAGAVLAYLATYDVRQAEVGEARVALSEARVRLASEVAHAEAQIAQAKQAGLLADATLDHQRKELARMKSLHSAEALPGHLFDDQVFLVRSCELNVGKAQAELAAAQAGLERVRRAISIKSAEARVATVEALMELSVIRAPIAGEVLRVMTYPGENIGNLPILQLGDTANMFVVAEVHETDIRHVKPGQPATVSSRAFEGTLKGTVDEIGALIFKNDVLDIDPRANTDTRVIEVRVKLENSAAVASLSNLEAHVRIALDGGSASAQRR